MNSEEIQKAIGAHGMWKTRLASAIDSGNSDVRPEQLEPDNLCPFGKWLHGLPPGERTSDHYRKVQAVHASFHKEAANVLRLALSAQKAEAKKSMGPGGAYALASANLTTAMMAWRTALGG